MEVLLLLPQKGLDYELIDSGNFERLERFGAYILARPEPKAMWNKSMSDKEWQSITHTRYQTGTGFGKAGKEESGTWKMLKKMPEQWNITYQGTGFHLTMRLGLTAFKHIGIFPEQAPNWDFIYEATSRLVSLHHPINHLPFSTLSTLSTLQTYEPSNRQTVKLLNLFAYTGGASITARAAGADVTHLDAVRQVVTWARENMEISGLDGIRWMVEDAIKFVQRQVRRGALYQGIILDPPAYGHGPQGERWKLDECLFELLQECNSILAPQNSFVLLNLYSNGYSAVLANTLALSAFGTSGSSSFGELMVEDSFGKRLPLSVFARIKR